MNAISAETLRGIIFCSLSLENKLEIKKTWLGVSPKYNKNHNESVIDKFVTLKERRMNFSYKRSS